MRIVPFEKIPALVLLHETQFRERERERTDIPHPEYGIDEVRAKGALTAAVFIDNGVGESAIEEMSIGVEESPPTLKILATVIIENDLNLEIGRHRSRRSCFASFEQMRRQHRFCRRRALKRSLRRIGVKVSERLLEVWVPRSPQRPTSSERVALFSWAGCSIGGLDNLSDGSSSTDHKG
ncbi:hypothetical protein U1Q18_001401 [Sarracenia purpurea var. burkii]